ncbi:hypothetical protein [Nocardia goodfellowii]|uniref:PE domain-containing protein n=1 Tax=Nocardia goodfellowii TaxID=882446 RepID=A0ABS4QQV1_9NOCA|nr:hypothetical protein [Nocardia goodfellowii]MBP2193031.1 hypothetical protein [Nocardia goodfellowii]
MMDSGVGSRDVGGFELEIGQLRSAAEAAGSAAGQAGALDPGTGLDAIAAALPGGDAARSGRTLALTFNERAKGWAGEVGYWSAAVASAAELYSDNEDLAVKAFGG